MTFGVEAASGSPVTFTVEGSSTPVTSFNTINLNHTGGESTSITPVVAKVNGTGLINYGGNVIITSTKANLGIKYNVNYSVTS